MPPMNEQEMHDRLLKLEFRQESTEKMIDVLHEDNKSLNGKLSDISKTIFQIKWIAVGCLGMATAYAIGLTELLKKLFS